MPDYIIAEHQAKQARRELRRLALARKREQRQADQLKTWVMIAGWVVATLAVAGLRGESSVVPFHVNNVHS